MNQILVTEKIYVTPELKKKKKLYKFEFFLSVFLVCILISICIYAEYDRNKSEEVSQDILNSINVASQETLEDKKDVLVVVFDEANRENSVENITPEETVPEQASSTNNRQVEKTSGGYEYTKVGIIKIPKIGIEYPIIDGLTDSVQETEALLKISPIKFWGPDPNEIGNVSIVGHNYRNTRFFSKVPTLENGDIIEITNSATGQTINYAVYKKYQVVPEDTSCLDETLPGQREVTLITCTNDSKERIIEKAKEV